MKLIYTLTASAAFMMAYGVAQSGVTFVIGGK